MDREQLINSPNRTRLGAECPAAKSVSRENHPQHARSTESACSAIDAENCVAGGDAQYEWRFQIAHTIGIERNPVMPLHHFAAASAHGVGVVEQVGVDRPM